MLIDIHVHATGAESAEQIVEGMDRVGLDRILPVCASSRMRIFRPAVAARCKRTTTG